MNRQKPEDVLGSGPGRRGHSPGRQYLESLRDGREVYIYGERVEDVTTHPAFRNSARTIARLYDALHDPKQKDVLTCPTDTGSGGFTHKFFRVAHSRDDLIGQRDAIAHWARLSYGWMGRSPDYKASLMNALGANARVLREVRRQCDELVRALAEPRAVHEPRHRQSAGRPDEGRRTRSRTCSSASRRKPTPASWCRAPRWWRRRPRSRTTTSWARTRRSRSTTPIWPSCSSRR